MNETDNTQTEQERQAQLSEKLQIFGVSLQAKMQDEVSKRGDIEERWLKDLRQYNGKYQPDEWSEISQSAGSKVFVNITRNKTNAAEARLSDMLFPTDDRNWGIKPTPVPELSRIAEDANHPHMDLARQEMEAAKDAAEAMTREIEDQLIESSYAAVCRDAIHDACKIGTGIIKGPVVVNNTRRMWNVLPDGAAELVVQENLAPETRYVDPWNWYPQHSAARVEDSEYFFERDFISKKKLVKLAKNPNYLSDQIRLVLEEGTGKIATTHNWHNDIRAISGVGQFDQSGSFEMWEYNGIIERDELEAAGIKVDEEDALTLYFGTVTFIGSHVIRVSLHPMDTQDDLYCVFNWEKDQSCIFGFGVPYLMRSPQQVMNGSWRMILDNGGLSAGPQIVYDEDAIEPQNGRWELKPRKIWKKKKNGIDKVPVRDAFEIYQINNNQGELMNIFTTARQLADEETNMPLIAQGEQAGHITKTVRGMEMLMNSSNIVLRRAVKNFDDDVTSKHIQAYYNWNMQFNEKQEIKGDFQIDARGSSVLLAREMQMERLMTFSSLAGGNPHFDKRTDWDGLYKQLVKHLQIAADDVTLPEEEVRAKEEAEANQQPPMDPVEQGKLQLKVQELQMKQQQFEMKLQQDRELELTRIAANENITLAQLQQRTQVELHREQNKRDIAAGDQTIKQSEQALRMANLQNGYDTY